MLAKDSPSPSPFQYLSVHAKYFFFTCIVVLMFSLAASSSSSSSSSSFLKSATCESGSKAIVVDHLLCGLLCADEVALTSQGRQLRRLDIEATNESLHCTAIEVQIACHNYINLLAWVLDADAFWIKPRLRVVAQALLLHPLGLCFCQSCLCGCSDLFPPATPWHLFPWAPTSSSTRSRNPSENPS